MSLIAELKARGLIAQVTSEEDLEKLLESRKVSVYCGFDPTARSLHVGHVIPAIVLRHFQRWGHRPITLVGGATGMIGDPTGRDSERQLLSDADVLGNVDGIRRQLSELLDYTGDNAALMTNNHDWIGPMSFVEWLRDVGKYFTINYMIAKESVRRRLENREQGISYTEFSYMLLQAFDFAHLYEHQGCHVQVGGSDQWGNITAGTDLVHKKFGAQVFGITCPLLTTASGQKLGKSAGNAVWIDPELTSPYQFYQYWLQTEDQDVERWLKVFSFLPLDEIATIAAAHLAEPHLRNGQKRLAAEVTRLVHGEAGLAAALRATEALFGGDLAGLSARDLAAIFADVPASTIPRTELEAGLSLVDLLATTLFASKGEARRNLAQGAVYVNNVRVEDAERRLTPADLLGDDAVVLRMGRKKYHVVRVA